MRLHLPVILGFMLTGLTFAADTPPSEIKKSDNILDQSDTERKEKKKLLDNVYKNIPTAQKLENLLNESLAILLATDTPEKANAAAKRIKELNQQSSELKKAVENELSNYFKNTEKLPENPEFKVFMHECAMNGNLFLELIDSLEAQGLLTQELADVCGLKKVSVIAELPPTSPELKNYWEKLFSQTNKLNQSLFSLKEKKDIPRVTKELLEIKKEREELLKIRDKIYPLKSESDKKADEILMNRISQGPIRISNVMLSVVAGRGFIKTNDPDMKDISKLIGELTR